MNNLERSKKLLFKNLKGSFLTIVYRTQNNKEPFDFLSPHRVSFYYHFIIKTPSKYIFPDFLSDIILDDTRGSNYGLFELPENLKNPSFFFTSDEIKNYKKDLYDNIEDKISDMVDTIKNILQDSSIAFLNSNHKLFDGFSYFKIKYFHDFTIPIYLLNVEGNEVKKIELINDEEDILKSLNIQNMFIKEFSQYI